MPRISVCSFRNLGIFAINICFTLRKDVFIYFLTSELRNSVFIHVSILDKNNADDIFFPYEFPAICMTRSG